MTLICYRDQSFTPDTWGVIEQAQGIIEEYEALGFSLTLRQAYYQFVSRDLIPNNLRSYKRLGNIINNGRMAGLLSWDAIEDRTRNLHEWQHYDSPLQAMRDTRRRYFIDRWDNQTIRPEVWIEKDALVGVITNVCAEFDVPYFACRGYGSQSEMWRAGQRCAEVLDRGQVPLILYLGDLDPSGWDMSRDIEERLALFAGESIEVIRLGLNKNQVDAYKPPPNPAKFTDSRAASYIREFGRSCWELDALDPRVIADLIRTALRAVIDEEAWAASGERMREERITLDGLIASISGDE